VGDWGLEDQEISDSLVSSFRAQARNLCHSRSGGQCLEIPNGKPAIQETFGHRPLCIVGTLKFESRDV